MLFLSLMARLARQRSPARAKQHKELVMNKENEGIIHSHTRIIAQIEMD